MPAKNKTELLEVTYKEFDKLSKIIENIDEITAQKKAADDTSIKDIVAHRAHWIGLFLGWYKDGLAGKTVFFPAEGYKWNDLKRYNSDLRKQQSEMGWKSAVEALQTSYGKLTNLLEDYSNDDLYGAPMKGGNNHWTPGRWAEAAGPSHFRSASKYHRSTLKKAK